jgi:hypothetical protein
VNFGTPSSWNDCAGGDKYVKRTPYYHGLFLGVQLCSPTRYKLFLSDSVSTEFKHIADGSGHGTDHCELMAIDGVSEQTARASDEGTLKSPSAEGKKRRHFG